MALPGNGIFVVRGEMSTLMTAMKRGARWSSTSYQEEEPDSLMKQFVELKQILNQIEDLRLIDPGVFLAPFLEVIRTEETTGVVTSLALSAVNKFLSYGLIDPTHSTLAATVENIADAVTHARFMGTDHSSDGVTLMRVVEVLHTLMRSPEGSALTNESVCEVMLSCFKICFEPRLNELLRRTAEQALKDMVLLLFMRLPQFSDEHHTSGLIRKFKMIAGSMDQHTKKKKSKNSVKQSGVKPNAPRVNLIKNEEKSVTVTSVTSASTDPLSPVLETNHIKVPPLATTPATPGSNIVDMQGKITQTPLSSLGDGEEESTAVTETQTEELQQQEQNEKLMKRAESIGHDADVEDELVADAKESPVQLSNAGEYINSVGVRFTQQKSIEGDGSNPLLPYGLPCIQELFRFLVLLCNPLDKQNSDTMMHMGLSLLTVAFEVAADNIGKYDTLLTLVKDEMCRNLFSLLNSERLTIFAADLQVCFLLFESLRSHLKFQLEFYLTKLSEIIASENPRTPYEMRELALDNLLQLWRIPGFVAELYVNYDCDLYCSDVFENLTKLLSKNTLSATNSIYSTHIFSLDTLISVIENIERNCISAKTGNPLPQSTRHSRNNSGVEAITIDTDLNASGNESSGVENITTFMYKYKDKKRPDVEMVSKEQLAELKNKKRILAQGTELFNQRPEKGIQFLQESGLLNPALNPMEIAVFLRENPGLDKKMIGEYISKKKNVESKILDNFVKSFDFANLRIDQALRLYLETFRLPGEAPLIFLVMEHFAEHWHKCNDEPFANTDAAFKLAYSIIMLNMDQHNYNAKRLNVPMTAEDFAKNLRGLNGNKDFDQDMLSNIFNAIKNEEIVMPAEQTGLVRENYLWKVLLRRKCAFHHVYDSSYDKELFNIIWGPSLAALSFMFDKSSENGYQKSLNGFTKCAGISAYYNLHEDFDALILTLCKFTSLLNIQPEANDITVAVSFGLNQKAQTSMKTVFGLVHDYGDCLRESWKNILEVIIQLFRLKLLPKSLMEVEDFCEANGKATLILEKPNQKSDAGLFSSLYSYLSSEGQREPTYEEQEIMKIAKKCIKECQIDQIVSETKFVQFESLQELLKCLWASLKAPNAHKSVGLSYSEDITVFLMEMLVRIVIQNRDRMISLWPPCKEQIYFLLMGGANCGYDYLLNRTTIALLKLAIYLMRNEELCPIVLQSLKILLLLKPNVIYRISKQISIGMYELLKTSAQNIHTEADWQIIFTLLECVGAAALPPEFEDSPPVIGTKSDGALSSEEDSGLPDRGYISDSEVVSAKSSANSPVNTPFSPSGENWILVNKDAELSTTTRPQSPIGSTLVYSCKLLDHLPFALFKCWDSLAFIVRNVAHITPYNFESCVRCIRTFVEACLDGGIKMRRKMATGKAPRKKGQRKDSSKNRRRDENSSESEDEELSQRYETLAIQLLDLMYTLYTRTAQIFRWWAEEGCAVPQCSALWAQGWCPLLQGIARLALDRRREVRTYAISCLQQRALLVHDLQTLSGSEWASCFKQVLFPLLNELLPESPSIAYIDSVLLEESRIRTATIMSKVFLHHLTPLIELSTFNDLWFEILDYIEKFMKVGSDMLSEQMQEILKNMLLVMHSVRIFHHNDGTTHAPLWELTWKRIGEFLPNLRDELFRDETNRATVSTNQMIQANAGTPQNINALSPSIGAPNTDSYSSTQGFPFSHESSLIMNNKGSIILQPPLDVFSGQTVILGQSASSASQPVPILLPQANLIQPHMMPNAINANNFPAPLTSGASPSHMQNSEFSVNKGDSQLPDLVNDASKLHDGYINSMSSPEISPSHEHEFKGSVYQIRNTTEFSNVIELPDTPPPMELQNSPISTYMEDPNGKYLDKDSEKKVVESSNSNDQQYSQYYQSQPPYQINEMPNQQLSTTANDNRNWDNGRVEKTEDGVKETNYNVPISHLIAGNQYPSLNRMPPSAIVQSFTPIYTQPQIPQSGTDIYSDYVQNPYNLTLQQQPLMSQETTVDAQVISSDNPTTDGPHTQVLGVSNMFQSANYFGGVDQSNIPPGSEMLFGRP